MDYKQMEYKIDEDWIEILDPQPEYGNLEPLNEITFKIIGACFEVHNQLGKGFLEVVYKDALMHELAQQNLSFEREKKYEIDYKGILLPHYYFSDFVVENKIILEVKAQEGIIDVHAAQLINYLKVSKCKLGLLVNFGEKSLKYKRFIF
jgi:GxxExxY protein